MKWRHSVVRREGVTRTRERPKNHDGEKSPAGAEEIDQPAAAKIHQTVSDEKSGIEKRLDLVGNGYLLPNLTNRHGQSLAIQVADGYGSADEKCNPPARIHWSQSNNNSLAGKLYLCPGE